MPFLLPAVNRFAATEHVAVRADSQRYRTYVAVADIESASETEAHHSTAAQHGTVLQAA